MLSHGADQSDQAAVRADMISCPAMSLQPVARRSACCTVTPLQDIKQCRRALGVSALSSSDNNTLPVFQLIVLARYLLGVPEPKSCGPTCTKMRH